MREQVRHGDTVSPIAGERRQIPGDRRVEVDPAFVEQDHDRRGRGHHLGE
jgi:hypothetical protein